MRRFIVLLMAAALPALFSAKVGAGETAPTPTAPTTSGAALTAAVAELGRINGQALACGYKEVVTRAKALMIMRVPKTRELGDTFLTATNQSFPAQLQSMNRAGCPNPATLLAQLEKAARPLPPAPGHQALADSNTPEPGLNPRYLLQDTNGRAFMDSDFRGRFQLIAFGYTFCPDICPTTLVEMAEVLKQLGTEAPRLQAIFVSLDPERDTLAVLRSYTAFFDPRILGATASPELVKRAADNFKVRYEKVMEPGAAPLNYALDHSAGLYLLGPAGEFVTKFAFATPVAEVVARIGEYLAQKPAVP